MINAHDGLLTITDESGAVVLGECWAGVAFTDGTGVGTEDAATEAERTAHGVRLRTPGSPLRPELRWQIEGSDDGSLRLSLEVENSTPVPLPIARLDVLVAPSGYRRIAAGALAVSQTGWDSWSPATPALPLPQPARIAPPPVIGAPLPPTEAERTVLPWVTFLRGPGGRSLLAGFLDAQEGAGILSLQPALEGHRLVAAVHRDGVLLPPGATVRSEPLLLRFDEGEEEALGRYAVEMAREMGATPWPDVTTGWCSWYYFFTKVSEEDVLRNLQTLRAARDRLPVEYVQLDDGYQAHIGDWLTLNEKFPRGMPFLTSAIRSNGYRPGLWLAPFLVSEESEVYGEHPEWVVRDEHDLPLNAIQNWNTRNFALDTTHPEAGEWLRNVIATVVEEWGYEYLKIDFIYAAALRGRRHDRGVTGIAAYRRGLQIIREAAGDAFILGCGAPFLPSVGLVHGMRIGPDTAPFWRNERDRYGSAPGLANAVRSTLAHGWMHGKLWINDPDCLLVRERDSQLTLAEVQSWTSVIGLSGGMVLMSDDLSRLHQERAALIPLLLPPYGEAAEPIGPYVDGMSERLRLPVERAWRSWLVAGQFNWSDEETSPVFNPPEWGLANDEPYHLFDLWSEEHLGPVSGPVEMGTVAPHGVLLLQVHPDLGRPQLVGSTLHLLGGAVELVDERWENGTLTIDLHCPSTHSGELFVYTPEGHRFIPDGAASTRTYDRLVVMSVYVRAEMTVTLKFEDER